MVRTRASRRYQGKATTGRAPAGVAPNERQSTRNALAPDGAQQPPGNRQRVGARSSVAARSCPVLSGGACAVRSRGASRPHRTAGSVWPSMHVLVRYRRAGRCGRFAGYNAFLRYRASEQRRRSPAPGRVVVGTALRRPPLTNTSLTRRDALSASRRSGRSCRSPLTDMPLTSLKAQPNYSPQARILECSLGEQRRPRRLLKSGSLAPAAQGVRPPRRGAMPPVLNVRAGRAGKPARQRVEARSAPRAYRP